MLKKLFSLFAVPAQGTFASAALFLFRVVVGLAFMLHGVDKIQNPWAWMGPDATTPALLQALAALSEFGGGLALIVGLLTPLASVGILCTMAVATHLHAVVLGHPFVGKAGSYELALVYLAAALLLVATGPGKYSLDYLFFKAKK